MIKNQALSGILFILTLILSACNNPQESGTVETHQPDTLLLKKELIETRDTTDHFGKAVDGLATINYLISGKDSIVVSNKPSDFIEMNGMRYCFTGFGNDSDTGLTAYNNVEQVRKFQVARGGKKHGPSATIVQISFPDSNAAGRWFERLSSSKNFEMIKHKPKKEMWTEGRYVYFIQSYYDMDRKILNTITGKFREVLHP
jgi:hypothetical protein